MSFLRAFPFSPKIRQAKERLWDRVFKRFNRRFSFTYPAAISRFSPPSGERRECPLSERSYRRRKLQASVCSCEVGLGTAGGVKTTSAVEAEVWKIRYPSSLSRPPRLWNGTLITLMGEPNVNYNSKSKRETIRGLCKSEKGRGRKGAGRGERRDRPVDGEGTRWDFRA